MKLSTLINSQTALKSLLETKLPVKIAYKLSKLVNLMQPDLKIYDEQRLKLVKDLGEETNAEKQEWTIKPENMTKYIEELNKLLDVEVSLGFGDGRELEKIKVEDLGDIQLQASDLIPLEWLVE